MHVGGHIRLLNKFNQRIEQKSEDKATIKTLRMKDKEELKAHHQFVCHEAHEHRVVLKVFSVIQSILKDEHVQGT